MNNTYTMKTRPNILETGTPLFCDLYHLTMAQAWFLDGKAEDYKVSEAFFRKCPFGGSYLMTAGLGEFMQWLERWRFSKEDIESLKNDRNEDGSRIFNDEFLQFLEGQELKVTIRAVPEGELVFPNEPVYSVSGPNWQVELAEAALLNIFNAQSLIATKASRMAYAANLDGKKRPLLEFGVRRGHELGGFSETRAAFIGGAAGTSNKAAAKHYGIRAAGTMAHSFVMSYEREVDAFKAFMRGNPHNTTLLVDTYDTREGIKNAIRAAKETGIKLMGIRIDSGDLAYWGNEARRLLCEAGMPEVRLAASNDLDEYLIESLKAQDAKINSWGVGTRLITSNDNPAFGGVYKLAAVKNPETGEFVPKIKLSENTAKVTNPGNKTVYRIYSKSTGKIKADLICLADEKLNPDETMVVFDPVDTWKKTKILGGTYEVRELLVPVIKEGKRVYTSPSVMELRAICQKEQSTLWDESRRFSNPQKVYVDLSPKLFEVKRELIEEMSRKDLEFEEE